MKPNVVTYIVSALSLLAGGAIYICYRPTSLAMFSVAGISESSGWLRFLRDNAPAGLPDWCVYALPDGLWSFSYSTFIAALWNFKSPQCMPIAMIIPCVGLVSEILQWFNILPGIFDWSDFLMYLAGGGAGILYILIFQSIIIKKHEEK